MADVEKLSGAMTKALKGLNLDLRMREARAMALWPAIVGDVTASRTRALHVQRGTLVVAVESSAWANQLNLLKPQLLAKLAEKVGQGVVRDLRWRTGPIEEPEAPTPNEAPGLRRAPSSDPPLEANEREAIARWIEAIPDPLLAARIQGTLEAQARRKKRHKQDGWAPCKRCGVLYDPNDPAAQAGGDEPVDPIAGSRLCPPCRMEWRAVLE